MKYNRYPKRDAVKNYFPLPNEIFCLDLSAGEIAVYAYLMYCEDRKTFQCHPSYKTIGTAVGLSSVAMLYACPNAKLTTLELEEERYLEAKENFVEFGVADRVNAYMGGWNIIFRQNNTLVYAFHCRKKKDCR